MIQLFSVKDLSKKYTHPQKLKVFKKIMRFLKVCTNTPEIRVLKKNNPQSAWKCARMGLYPDLCTPTFNGQCKALHEC